LYTMRSLSVDGFILTFEDGYMTFVKEKGLEFDERDWER